MSTNIINIYAGFLQRVRAFALDYVVILLYIAAITLLNLVLNSPFGVNHLVFSITHWPFANRVSAQLTGFMLLTLPISLYFAISESSKQRASWGKKRLGLHVVDATGSRISFGRSVVRTLLKFIPWELSHTLIWTISFSPQLDSVFINFGFGLVYALIGLNIASLLMTKKHQTIYDLIAKTYVVKQAS